MSLLTTEDIELLIGSNTFAFDRWVEMGPLAARIALSLPTPAFRPAVRRMVVGMVEHRQYGVVVAALDALETHGSVDQLAELRPIDFASAFSAPAELALAPWERVICFLHHLGTVQGTGV